MQFQIFKYEEIIKEQIQMDNLTTINIEGEAWFVASEVCSLLDISDLSSILTTLDTDEKNTIDINSEKTTIVSESGMYALIFQSSKPTAKKFRKWITKEVIPAIRKTGSYGINRLETPNFVIRFNDNWDRTDKGYFSVISELFVRLYGRFEHIGYKIPNKAFDGREIRPDVSVGIVFAKHLRENHVEFANDYKMYSHQFPNGTQFDARQYKNDLLPIFIKFIDEKWIPGNAQRYFKKRDPVALDYLPKLLGA